ncbi:cell wall-active antibiotics response protein LiaF [Falseniella ignava]|uniref:Cell wall-active antibiotics response LiaF-like C-terminal domain-containing protein n=1 Tax=Falseniella ignava CCUG 37419 TaxID=883112 RepID=K1LMA8_9LACT|nr:cell wall-active antibiotics response protein LiaF [Falseniella ignava]EKB57990.1 hypothetical protein HMPREF9707_00450 [Falseniella ignava CCUG 37419]
MKLDRRNVLIAVILSLLLLFYQLVHNLPGLTAVTVGLLIIMGTLFIKKSLLIIVVRYLSLLMIFVGLFLVPSFWAMLVVLLIFYLSFRSEEGHLLMNLSDAFILSPQRPQIYQGVVLKEPIISQQQTIDKRSVQELYGSDSQDYAWDDINIVYFGGSQMIDFGNTVIPNREITVIIRKVLGRTRVVIPKDIALKIHLSSVVGEVDFQSERYELMAESLKWQSENYTEKTPRINLMISQVFGNIEVILV